MNRRSFLSSLAALTPIGLLLANHRRRLANIHQIVVKDRMTDTERKRFMLKLLKEKGRIVYLPPVEYKWIIPRETA